MFSVLVIRLRSLRLLRVSGIVMRLRMFLLLITFLKASHSFRNRLLVICKNAYLFRSEERRVGKEGRFGGEHRDPDEKERVTHAGADSRRADRNAYLPEQSLVTRPH